RQAPGGSAGTGRGSRLRSIPGAVSRRTGRGRRRRRRPAAASHGRGRNGLLPRMTATAYPPIPRPKFRSSGGNPAGSAPRRAAPDVAVDGVGEPRAEMAGGRGPAEQNVGQFASPERPQRVQVGRSEGT